MAASGRREFRQTDLVARNVSAVFKGVQFITRSLLKHWENLTQPGISSISILWQISNFYNLLCHTSKILWLSRPPLPAFQLPTKKRFSFVDWNWSFARARAHTHTHTHTHTELYILYLLLLPEKRLQESQVNFNEGNSQVSELIYVGKHLSVYSKCMVDMNYHVGVQNSTYIVLLF